jgi:Molecular chaperone GrpE (heat shock protein)
MWAKARSLARHLKPAFVNLKLVSTEDPQINIEELSDASPDETAAAGPAELLAQAAAERDQLRTELAELQDRLLRRQAEFENVRRRNERDRSEFLEYAGMEIVRELLPILDDFDRAAKTECSDATYRQGIDLISQRFADTLKKIGLEPIEVPPGTEFDPNLHQAVVRLETEAAPDNTILEEFQRGYNFKGKLLRPAMVKVAVKPA